MQRIVITGVTSGFGQQWLYELDKQPDIEFFVLARNKHKYQSMLKEQALNNKVHFVQCDLSSINSIHAAADQVHQLTDHIDILINNAGHWSGNHFTPSADGIESTLAVNQIAPFLLTGRLLPLLANAKQARVVNTASFRHKDAKLDLDDIQLSQHFNAERAYCNSKLYSVLFTQTLAEKLSNSRITVNCFDPGIVDTPMLKQALPPWLSPFYGVLRHVVARSPDKGAQTGVYLCQSTHITTQSGLYLKDKKIKTTAYAAKDPELRKWLWQKSGELSGFDYSFDFTVAA
jgi:NAD(P)-dependent dehydrogenase (short-subunit alcohol dehydrogenase family)